MHSRTGPQAAWLSTAPPTRGALVVLVAALLTLAACSAGESGRSPDEALTEPSLVAAPSTFEIQDDARGRTSAADRSPTTNVTTPATETDDGDTTGEPGTMDDGNTETEDLGDDDDRTGQTVADAESAPNAGDRSDSELLDIVEPLDQAPEPDKAIGIRDGQRINEAGEANELDEAASLACGDVEVALTSLDEGQATTASQRLVSAAERASNSANATISEWTEQLEQAAIVNADGGPEPTTLFGFLTACTQGGYEL